MRYKLQAYLLSTVCMMLAGTLRAETAPPTPPSYDKPCVDDFSFANADSAQKQWKPMNGSAGVAPVTIGARHALRMPCNFHGTSIERASWDRTVKLDLTACRGLRFDFYCADSTPVAYFSLYMHSGNGWYSLTFGAATRKGWGTVLIDKTDTQIEGTPGGWGVVDTIRISAWRGKDADTEFYIANLALDGTDAPIAIIRGESVEKESRDEARTVAEYSKVVASTLDQLGLPYVVMSDVDATIARLQGKKVAILPYNPSLPPETAKALQEFVKSGGKLQVFYIIDSRFAKELGVGGGAHLPQKYEGQFATIRSSEGGLAGMPRIVGQASWNIRQTQPVQGVSRVVATWFNAKGESTGEPAIIASDRGVFMTHVLLSDDPVAKRAMMLAMLGSLDTSLWKLAVTNCFDRVGRFSTYEGYAAAAADIRNQAQGNDRAMESLKQSDLLHQNAVKLSDGGKYAEALESLAQSHANLLAAFCAAQKPQAGEHRAWWCHSATGVSGMSWDEAVRTLAENGFTAVLPNMLWGGVAYYDSRVLPVAPLVRQQGDQIAACVAACKKYGVQCHVWKVNWNMGYAVDREFMERMNREGRTQANFAGTSEPRWLCPSHPANQQLEIDAMVEVATKYDVDGIHFDYIRYPGGDNCFCAGCRQRFEAVLGSPVPNWPADTRKDPTIRQKWLDFRRDNITKVVAAVHDAVKKQKPKVKISAAVFRNWPTDRDGVGQDWKLWCERGYMDFVCPMDYTSNDVEFENIVTQQIEWASGVPCYPGIGLSTWTGDPDVAKVIDQIKITRRLKTGGFTIFNYGVPEAKQVAPMCGLGITRRE